MSTWALAPGWGLGSASGLWRSSTSLPGTAGPHGRDVEPKAGGEETLKSFLVNRGLMKRKLSLLSSCPKLSEFRKEHTIIVSAVFYFGSGRPKTTGRREIKVPIQSLPFPRIRAIFHLPPCPGAAHNAEHLLFFYKPRSLFTKLRYMFWFISVLSILLR